MEAAFNKLLEFACHRAFCSFNINLVEDELLTHLTNVFLRDCFSSVHFQSDHTDRPDIAHAAILSVLFEDLWRLVDLQAYLRGARFSVFDQEDRVLHVREKSCVLRNKYVGG